MILNREQQVIEAFAGELGPMHAAACEAARAFAMQAVPGAVRRRRDQQLRLSARPEPLPGGQGHVARRRRSSSRAALIVCAAECRDGFPGHGSYRQLLEASTSPRDFLRQIAQSDHVTPDQWQVQIQANIQDHARVVMHTEHLSDEELRSVHLEQTRDITGLVAAAGGTVCVLPEGPQTIAYVG